MKSPRAMTPDAQERLRELYRKCTTGLLLIPPTMLDDAPVGDDRAPASPRVSREAPSDKTNPSQT